MKPISGKSEVLHRDPHEVLRCPDCGLEMERRNWPVAGWPRAWKAVRDEFIAAGRDPKSLLLGTLPDDKFGLSRVCPHDSCNGVIEDAEDQE